jgi:hypothetical protein
MKRKALAVVIMTAAIGTYWFNPNIDRILGLALGLWGAYQAIWFRRNVDDWQRFFKESNRVQAPETSGNWRPWKRGLPESRPSAIVMNIIAIISCEVTAYLMFR